MGVLCGVWSMRDTQTSSSAAAAAAAAHTHTATAATRATKRTTCAARGLRAKSGRHALRLTHRKHTHAVAAFRTLTCVRVH